MWGSTIKRLTLQQLQYFKTLSFLKMSTPIPAFTNVNVSNWSFGELKKNPNNGGSIRMKQSSTNSSAPVFILDRMRTPFGIEEPMADEGKLQQATESSRRSLTLNVENPALQSWLSGLDEHLITWVTTNSSSVFNRVIKRSTVEDVIYYRALRPAKGEYAPTFRVKVNISGANATKFLINIPGTTQFFQGGREDVLRGSEIIPTLTAYSMWVTNAQIGVTFIATHLLVFQPSTGSANPYEGYTEAPRPRLSASSAPFVGSGGAAAASSSSGGAAAGSGDEKFTFDDPNDMF